MYIIDIKEKEMKAEKVKELLNAKVLAGSSLLDQEILTACGADMMSDVLAFSKDHSVLLTGLCNPQVIRTAEMLDISCIVFVRGKCPDQMMINMAEDREILIMTTECLMFPACGILYKEGIRGGAV